MVYAPELSVVAVRERPLTALARITVALAMTAPVGSVTRPEMVPAFPADWTRAGAGRRGAGDCAGDCAETRGANRVRDVARMTDAAEMPRRLDVFIKFPLMHCLLRVDEFVSGNDVN